MGSQEASASWNGSLKEGNGSFTLPKAGYSGDFSFATRFESADGTNPEELVGAAIASCYSMFLSALLTNNGFTNKKITTKAAVTLDRDDMGPVITTIALTVSADILDITNDQFQGYVQEALEKCPISRLYAAVDKTVAANLLTVSS
ncbi:peroxiredoxin [bacterium]|nr:peroxiredoxin [bacterium]|tara:strand:- start:1213 stop:1650 length:438 start_codon:yes stop_codon:yes gene_type:complete